MSARSEAAARASDLAVAARHTLAEAVEAVRAGHERRAANPYLTGAGTTTITEVVRRGEDEAARVVTELVSRRLRVRVTCEEPAGPPGAVAGWRFFGWASC